MKVILLWGVCGTASGCSWTASPWSRSCKISKNSPRISVLGWKKDTKLIIFVTTVILNKEEHVANSPTMDMILLRSLTLVRTQWYKYRDTGWRSGASTPSLGHSPCGQHTSPATAQSSPWPPSRPDKTHLGDAPRAVRAWRGVGEIHNPREVGIFRILDGREGKVGVGPGSRQGGGEGEGGEDKSSLEQQQWWGGAAHRQYIITHNITEYN